MSEKERCCKFNPSCKEYDGVFKCFCLTDDMDKIKQIETVLDEFYTIGYCYPKYMKLESVLTQIRGILKYNFPPRSQRVKGFKIV